MKRSFLAGPGLLLLGLCCSLPAAAQIVNGSFEDTPDHLNGWTLGPGARVEALESNDFGPTSIPVPDGGWMVLISTGPGDVPTAPSGDFDVNGTMDQDSSTLSTTFTTTLPNATLGFTWAFLTDEVGSGGQGQALYDDLFEVTVDGISVLRGSVRKPGGSSPFPDTVAYDGVNYVVNSPGLTDGSEFGSGLGGGRTPLQTTIVTIAQPGVHTLEFRVADQGDTVFDSALLVDDVTVTDSGTTLTQLTTSTETLTEVKGGGLFFTAVDNRVPAISADGSQVTFLSNGDYSGDNPNLQDQIWVGSRAGATFTLSRLTSAVDQEFGDPDISSMGQWIVFASTADITGGNGDGNLELFRHDRIDGTFVQLTSTAGCTNKTPTIDGDGDRVAFVSDCDFGLGTNGEEIVLWDNGAFSARETSGCTSRTPRISRDSLGEYVTFLTDCSAGYPGIVNPDGGTEVLQWDIQAGSYLQVTATAAGFSTESVVSSADGRFVGFVSDAEHDAGQNPGAVLVAFLYDRNSGSIDQMVAADPVSFFTAVDIDDTGAYMAVERLDLFTFGFDMFLVATTDPGTLIPIAAGSFDVFNSLPAVGLYGTVPQVVFQSNGEFDGDNADANIELWISGVAVDPPTPGIYCSTPNVAIPDNDNAGVSDVISVPDSGIPVDLDLIVRIEHTWAGDLRVDLRHLDTDTNRRMIDRPGRPPGAGCSGDDIDVTLDDEAASDVENECVTPGPVSIQGSFRPQRTLARFDGEEIFGDWRLTVSDRGNGDVGTLLEWCLVPTLP